MPTTNLVEESDPYLTIRGGSASEEVDPYLTIRGDKPEETDPYLTIGATQNARREPPELRAATPMTSEDLALGGARADVRKKGEDIQKNEEEAAFEESTRKNLRAEGFSEPMISAMMMPGGESLDRAISLAAPIAGNVAGTTFPVAGPATPFIAGGGASALANIWAQLREHARSGATKPFDFKKGRFAGEVFMGAVIPASAKTLAPGRRAAQVIETGTTLGGQMAAIGAGESALRQLGDEGTIDFRELAQDTGRGAGYGVALGGAFSTASQIYKNLKLKNAKGIEGYSPSEIGTQIALRGGGGVGGFAYGWSSNPELPFDKRLENALLWASASGGLAPTVIFKAIKKVRGSGPAKTKVFADWQDAMNREYGPGTVPEVSDKLAYPEWKAAMAERHGDNPYLDEVWDIIQLRKSEVEARTPAGKAKLAEEAATAKRAEEEALARTAQQTKLAEEALAARQARAEEALAAERAAGTETPGVPRRPIIDESEADLARRKINEDFGNNAGESAAVFEAAARSEQAAARAAEELAATTARNLEPAANIARTIEAGVPVKSAEEAAEVIGAAEARESARLAREAALDAGGFTAAKERARIQAQRNEELTPRAQLGLQGAAAAAAVVDEANADPDENEMIRNLRRIALGAVVGGQAVQTLAKKAPALLGRSKPSDALKLLSADERGSLVEAAQFLARNAGNETLAGRLNSVKDVLRLQGEAGLAKAGDAAGVVLQNVIDNAKAPAQKLTSATETDIANRLGRNRTDAGQKPDAERVQKSSGKLEHSDPRGQKSTRAAENIRKFYEEFRLPARVADRVSGDAPSGAISDSGTGRSEVFSRAGAVDAEQLLGDGRRFASFFSDVSAGNKGRQGKGKLYTPVITLSGDAAKFAEVRKKYRGNFDNHIATSIPGFNEVQSVVGNAITKYLGKGGAVLDIGASEGALIKSISELSGGKIETVALDPNFKMAEHFNRTPVKGSRYVVEAFGSADEAGKLAWNEDAGNVNFFDPKGQKFDIVHEAMVFQFISNARNAQIARVKELLTPEGLVIVEEKVGNRKDIYLSNEAKKDAYKSKYYTPEEMETKRLEVLGGGDKVEGMTELQVSAWELEQSLAKHFTHVTQFWDSGNFKGYVAGDSRSAIKRFVANLANTGTEYSTVKTPREVTGIDNAKALVLVHYSSNGNLTTVNPTYLGKGVATQNDRRGLPKSFYFEQDSPLSGDRDIVSGVGKTVYGARVASDRIYDGNTDALGYWGITNRETADSMLVERGYAGFAVTGNDGRNTVTMFEPLAVKRIGRSGGETRAGGRMKFGGNDGFGQREVLARIALHGGGGAGGFAYGWSANSELPPDKRLERSLMWAAAAGGLGPAAIFKAIKLAQGSGPAKIPRAKLDPKTASLDDLRNIFIHEAEKSPSLLTRINRTTEVIQDRNQPLTEVEEAVLGSRPQGLTLGDRASLIAGAAGKAEAALTPLIELRKNLSPEVDDLDVSTFLFLRRTMDRLETNKRNAATYAAQQANYVFGPKPVAPTPRDVGTFTEAIVRQKMGLLQAKLGNSNLLALDALGAEFQKLSDSNLQTLVDAGRLSNADRATIKADNDFYAPFKVMKYMSAVEGVKGTGRAIDTSVSVIKAIKGIKDEDIQLGDIMLAMGENTLRTHVLAEKNRVMLALAALADADPTGKYIQRVAPHKSPPSGFVGVNYMKDGSKLELAVLEPVARAVKGLNEQQLGVVGAALKNSAAVFRLGTVGANIGFQLVNSVKDQKRFAELSKYGFTSVADLYRYPMDFAEAAISSWKSNILGKKNQLALDFMKSGSAGSTIAETLAPSAFRPQASVFNPLSYGIEWSARIGKGIEETTKIMGYKRGARLEGLEKLTGTDRQKALDRIAYEVRNYAGSPDFNKHGTIGLQMNILFMFANARMQGVAADMRRLSGRTGGREAVSAMGRLAVGTGLPTLALWYYNQQGDNLTDYEALSKREKTNNWMIPQYGADGKPLYFINEEGYRKREYIKLPKTDILAQTALITEGMLNFAKDQDPKAAMEAGQQFLENLSPINISGRNNQERVESIISGLNPILKTPLEFSTGRDTFRHQPIVPRRLEGAPANLQFRDSTNEIFKDVANQMSPDASPLQLQRAVENMTGGLATQFMRPEQPGRSLLVSSPFFGRFFGSPAESREKEWEIVNQWGTKATGESVVRGNAIRAIVNNMGKQPEAQTGRDLFTLIERDPKSIPAIISALQDKSAGTTSIDKALKGLPTKARAGAMMEMLGTLKTPEEKSEYLESMVKRGVLTKDVMVEMRNSMKKP